MNNLCIISCFKNEGHILAEWLAHHLAEGVEHFYLIDNGSTDDYIHTLQHYIDRGVVTLYLRPDPHGQVNYLTEVFNKVKHDNKWCALIDLDEFIFSPNHTNLVDYLADKDAFFGVAAHWTLFSSRDEYKQPESVVGSFIWQNSKVIHDGTKCIIQSSKVEIKRMELHCHQYKLYNPNVDFNFLIDDDNLKIFHYIIQSREYFDRVKRQRGDAIDPSQNGLRNDAYFKSYDKRDRINTLLRDRRMQI